MDLLDNPREEALNIKSLDISPEQKEVLKQEIKQETQAREELDKKVRKVRKDKGVPKFNMRKPQANKRLTTKQMLAEMKSYVDQVVLKGEVLPPSGLPKDAPYQTEPAAEMSYPDEVDYVGLDPIPPAKQLENSRSDSESFRDATGYVLNKQIHLSSGNLNSGGLVFL